MDVVRVSLFADFEKILTTWLYVKICSSLTDKNTDRLIKKLVRTTLYKYKSFKGVSVECLYLHKFILNPISNNIIETNKKKKIKVSHLICS